VNMTQLAIAELFKLRKRMMTWVLAFLLVAIIVLLYSILWSISGRSATFGEHGEFTAQQLRDALFLPSSVPFSLQLVSSFGTLFAVIFAAGAVGSEYAWGTVRLGATAASGRLRLLGARLIVVSALIAIGALLAVVTGLVYSTVIMSASGGADFGFITASFVAHQMASFGRTLFVLAPYVAIAFAAAVVGRSTLAGVGAGLGFTFLEPLISSLMRAAGGVWSHIPDYLPSANKQVILLQNRLPDVLRVGPGADLKDAAGNSVEKAALILVLYTVAFVALGLYTYRRRDITAGA
jgi:ABC-2 type transport system permease protein